MELCSARNTMTDGQKEVYLTVRILFDKMERVEVHLLTSPDMFYVL